MTRDDRLRVATPPPLYLAARSENGVWRATQIFQVEGGVMNRSGFWKEPPGMFRGGFDQCCWHFPNMGGPWGVTFCSDTTDPQWFGIVEDLRALLRLGFVRLFGEVVGEKESGAAPFEATP